MSSYFFAGQPAASAVARGLVGSGANDPVISDEPRRRPHRARGLVSRSLHRIADSVSGS